MSHLRTVAKAGRLVRKCVFSRHEMNSDGSDKLRRVHYVQRAHTRRYNKRLENGRFYRVIKLYPPPPPPTCFYVYTRAKGFRSVLNFPSKLFDIAESQHPFLSNYERLSRTDLPPRAVWTLKLNASVRCKTANGEQ